MSDASPWILLNNLLKIAPVQQFHDQIGSPVQILDDMQNSNDIGMAKLCQSARFFGEALQTPFKCGSRIDAARIDIACGITPRVFDRQIFFDSNLARQIHISGKVGNPKTACPKHLVDLIISDKIPWLQSACFNHLRCCPCSDVLLWPN